MKQRRIRWNMQALMSAVEDTLEKLEARTLRRTPWAEVAHLYTIIAHQSRTDRECCGQWSRCASRSKVPPAPFGKGSSVNVLRPARKTKPVAPAPLPMPSGNHEVHPADRVAGAMRKLVEMVVDEKLAAFRDDLLHRLGDIDRALDARIRKVIGEVFDSPVPEEKK